jgi:hypothetical protein
MLNGGANATKLLCAYKLWVNGVSVSAGPGRPTGKNSTIQNPALLYDTVNITSLIRYGSENVIAIEAFYWNEAQEARLLPSSVMDIVGDEGDAGGVLVLVRNIDTGETVVATGDQGGWLAFDRGDEALSHWSPPECQPLCPQAKSGSDCKFCAFTGGRFHLFHEHWDMRIMPSGTDSLLPPCI